MVEHIMLYEVSKNDHGEKLLHVMLGQEALEYFVANCKDIC